MKPSNRQAASHRNEQFEALAAFANMGDRPEEWRKFRLMFPDFFPTAPSGVSRPGFLNMSDWLYSGADDYEKQYSSIPNIRNKAVPPLLWYRDILRAVWTSNDRKGGGLYVLYGLESKGRAVGIPVTVGVISPLLIPGHFYKPDQRETSGLPQGEAIIDGLTGEISWEFGCEFQQSVFELMKVRWKARTCHECGKYFIADKTAQMFCSPECSGEAKRKRSLDHWNRKGSKIRKQKAAKAERRMK